MIQAGAPGGRARDWIAWAVASSCLLFQFVVQVQPSAMIDGLERSFDVDAVELGLLSSAYFLSYLLLQVPMGWLLDRFGPRIVLGASMILGAVGLLWFGTASNLTSAILARTGLGIAGAPAFAAAALVASRGFPAARFGLMIGLTEAFTLLGGVAVVLGLPLLDRAIDRTGSGIALAILSMVLAVACLLLVEGGGRRSTEPGAVTSEPPTRSVARTILDPSVLLAGLHAGLLFSIIASFGGLWAAPFLRARLELDPVLASQPVAILFAAGVLGAPLLGLVSGRPLWRGPVLIIASVLCAVSACMLINAPVGTLQLLLLLALLGFFGGVFAVDMAAVRDVVEPARRGLALGTANMILGVVGGPVIMMLVARALDRTDPGGTVDILRASLEQVRGSLDWFVGGLACAVPVGILLVLLLRRRDRSSDVIG